MRSWMMILAALFCLNVRAEDTGVDKLLNASDSMNEEELVKAAESISKGGGSVAGASTVASVGATQGALGGMTTGGTTQEASAVAGATASDNTALPESQIPVFGNSSKEATQGQSSHALRLVGSMLLLCVLAGGLIIWGRKRGFQRNTPGHKVRIEVLTQFHFGPKKGLALVRVAGEVMLIGMTEHNINMIKSVTLIDDEVEGLMGKDFNKFLADDFSIESVQNALNAPV